MNAKQFAKNPVFATYKTKDVAIAEGFEILDSACSEDDAKRAIQLEKLTAKCAPFWHVIPVVQTNPERTYRHGGVTPFSAYIKFARVRAYDRTLSVLDKALEAKRDEVVAHMVERARVYVEGLFTSLAEKGNDLNQYAPYPDVRKDYYDFKAKVDLHNSVLRLVTYTGSYTGSRTTDREGNYIPQIVTRDDDKVAKFLARAEKDAHLDFDAYLSKMAQKIGQVTEASLDGTYLWNHSVLTVKTETGETIKWMTQMILNVSCLGTLFNQWPTRQIK